jgi:hypothetical protein
MATIDNKASRQRRLRLVLEGIDEHFRDLSSFKLGGAVIAPGDLKGHLANRRRLDKRREDPNGRRLRRSVCAGDAGHPKTSPLPTSSKNAGWGG